MEGRTIKLKKYCIMICFRDMRNSVTNFDLNNSVEHLVDV